jgi:hypothetical protein
MKRIAWLLLVSFVVWAGVAQASEALRVYTVSLANKHTIHAVEYSLDAAGKTISFKSLGSGLKATIPIDRVVRIDESVLEPGKEPSAENIQTRTVFANENSVAKVVDDGGIPCNFYVVVGGSSGRRRATSSRRSWTSSRGTSSRRSSPRGSAPRSGTSGWSSASRRSGFGTGTRTPSRKGWTSGGGTGTIPSGGSPSDAAEAFMNIFR